jgi:hypothetical protein
MPPYRLAPGRGGTSPRPAKRKPPRGRSSTGPRQKPGKNKVFRPPRQTPPSAAVQPPRTPAASDIGYSPPPLSGGGGSYNISADPAVMAAQGLAAKMRATAQASALAKRKQAAIEYGDPTGVEGIDAATSKAATENPFSVLKNLEHSYSTGKRDLEEGLNQSNLFYSGYRGQQLGEAARGYQGARHQAGTNFKGLMTDINDRLAEALLGADAQEASAIMGSDGGYYGGGGDSYSAGVPYNPNVSLARAFGMGLSGAKRTPGKSTQPKPKPIVFTAPKGVKRTTAGKRKVIRRYGK